MRYFQPNHKQIHRMAPEENDDYVEKVGWGGGGGKNTT